MKPLLASLAILFAVNMSAQPYNPDANSDGVLSASDLLPFLGGFGQPFTVVDSTCVTVHQLPSPPCDGWCWWEVPVCDFIIFEPNEEQVAINFRIFLPDSAPPFHVMTFICPEFNTGNIRVAETSDDLNFGPDEYGEYTNLFNNSLMMPNKGRCSFQFYGGEWYRMDNTY